METTNNLEYSKTKENTEEKTPICEEMKKLREFHSQDHIPEKMEKIKETNTNNFNENNIPQSNNKEKTKIKHRHKSLTNDEIKKINELYANGTFIKKISSKMQIVYYIIKRNLNEDNKKNSTIKK